AAYGRDSPVENAQVFPDIVYELCDRIDRKARVNNEGRWRPDGSANRNETPLAPGKFAYIRGLAMVAGPRKVHVYPSGLARETCSQARLPLAPGFASTTIGWCQISESLRLIGWSGSTGRPSAAAQK